MNDVSPQVKAAAKAGQCWCPQHRGSPGCKGTCKPARYRKELETAYARHCDTAVPFDPEKQFVFAAEGHPIVTVPADDLGRIIYALHETCTAGQGLSERVEELLDRERLWKERYPSE